MKKLILYVLSTLFFIQAYTAPVITAANNGLWENASTWDLKRVPASGDTVIIPFGTTVSIDVNLNMPSTTLSIDVYGALDFVGGGAKLTLSSASTIYVYLKGYVDGQNNSSQTIKIGGNTVFQGGAVVGPQMATSTTTGFIPFGIPSTLPVKFISFTLSHTNNDVLVQWSTAEEINSYRFEIERSLDGSNWSTIGFVNAAGNSNALTNYSYTDKNNTYRISFYRIKQTDLNGTFVYTPVKTINAQAGAADIQISFSDSRVFAQFSKEIRGSVTVRLVSMSGQVVSEQILSNPIGQIILNTKASLKGNYVVSITNNQEVHMAKQVIL